MRTTLDIDDAILAAARSIARDEGLSLGAAISQLALRGLTAADAVDTSGAFPTFTRGGTQPITLEVVNEFRD